jgi:hypothetical protein
MERGIGSTAAAVTAGEVCLVDPITGSALGTVANPLVTSSSGGGAAGQPSVASVTYASSSITSATGASQSLAAASATRKTLVIINPLSNTTDWTIDPTGGTAAPGTMPGFTLRPGDSWGPNPCPVNLITGIGTAASKLVVLVG